MDIAGEIKANLVGKGAKSEFNVLLEDEVPQELVEFLDQYLGKWTRVSSPTAASMQVLVPAACNRFHHEDVAWANELFDRDGPEARVYEFDRFENRIIARTRLTINSRKWTR